MSLASRPAAVIVVLQTEKDIGLSIASLFQLGM